MSSILYQEQNIPYRNESIQPPPREVIFVRETSADAILKNAHNNIATVWQGDFHNAKHVLAALKKRLKTQIKPENDPATAFHKYRLMQSQNSRLMNMLLIEILPNFELGLSRAPNIQAALNDVYDTPNNETFLLPLNQLLGFIGAYEWHKTGVFIAQLNARIHVPFGVFSPLRGEYLSLLIQARLPENITLAYDIGTGSGVLAAILAQRGIPKIIATDNNCRAINCARANIFRLNFNQQVTIMQQDLFPDGRADLIVCNPPWLPAKPTSAIETALYDPKHAMLHAFLRNAHNHLNNDGQVWLIMSDLAEHLGLRHQDDLSNWFNEYGWHISGSLKTKPRHHKARQTDNPLAFARNLETTSLYILGKK